MSEPTDKEMMAFIHGILSGLGAAATMITLGLSSEAVCQLLTDVETELSIPHAEPEMHPCFLKIQKTDAWKRLGEGRWGN